MRATRVDRTRVDTDGDTVDADVVIVATEGPSAAHLLDLRDVASNAVAAVYFAADEAPTDEPLVILNGRGGPVLNAAVMTNVNPAYAPAGKHLIVAAMPGVVEGELDDMARRTFRTWWGPAVEQWEALRHYRIAHDSRARHPRSGPNSRFEPIEACTSAAITVTPHRSRAPCTPAVAVPNRFSPTWGEIAGSMNDSFSQ